MLELPPLYDDLAFLSPLSEQRAVGLVAFLAGGRPGTVLDIGCGWGEFLLRAVEASPGSRGLGVDLEPQRLGEARRRVASRGRDDEYLRVDELAELVSTHGFTVESAQRERYLNGYRGVLGLAYLTLVAG